MKRPLTNAVKTLKHSLMLSSLASKVSGRSSEECSPENGKVNIIRIESEQ